MPLTLRHVEQIIAAILGAKISDFSRLDLEQPGP
jgi:hypothetical protein